MFKPKRMSPYHREELRSDFDRRWDADYISPVKNTPKLKGIPGIAAELCMNTTLSQEQAEVVVRQIFTEQLVAETPRNAALVDGGHAMVCFGAGSRPQSALGSHNRNAMKSMA